MTTPQQYYDATHIKWLRENMTEQAFRDWCLAQRKSLGSEWLEALEQQIIEDSANSSQV